MKKLFKTLPLMVLVGAVSVSCGKKENKSGGGGSVVAPPVVVAPNPGAGVTDVNAGQIDIKYYTYDQVKTEFNGVALNANTSVGQQIVHSGSRYTGSGVSASFDISFCFFGLGDCNQGNTQNDQQLLQLIQENEIKRIESVTASVVQIGYATDAYQGQIEYGEIGNFSKSSSIYQEMLGLDNSNPGDVVVSDAYVVDSNNAQIPAKHIEFISSYGYSSYVVSSALPLAANPIMINEGNGYYASTKGFLKQVGSRKIKQIQAVRHTMQQVQDPNNAYGTITKKVQASVFTIVNQ